MTKGEACNWLRNLRADIGKIEHRELWHYEQALEEIMELLKEPTVVDPLENVPTVEEATETKKLINEVSYWRRQAQSYESTIVKLSVALAERIKV